MAKDSPAIPPLEKTPYRRGDRGVDHALGSVLHEYDVGTEQLNKRRKLLRSIEKLDQGKKSGVLAFVGIDALGVDEVPAFGDGLLQLGDLDVLNLLIDSPGGDGTVAEKLINLCRAYCKFFRVIIPHRAKSAATIIALGADEILMGFGSELGPIDAQVFVMNNGVPQLISAQSFIDARDQLIKQFNEVIKKKEDPRAVLQQIATLDPTYIQHCEQLMGFGRDLAGSLLRKYMLRGLSQAEFDTQLQIILRELSSVQQFRVHGRMIDGGRAKTELGLNVRQLGREDEQWRNIYGYFMRASLCMNRGRMASLVETKSSILAKMGLAPNPAA